MAIYKTADNAKDERLVTNWYQNDYKECKAAVKRVCLNYGYEFPLVLMHRQFQDLTLFLDWKVEALPSQIKPQ